MTGLDGARVASLLRTAAYGRSLDVRGTTGSTNDDAKRASEEGAPRGHVVVADAQSAGRGSHGRTWLSPAGEDLYLSIVERTSLPAAARPPLTLAVGLGVQRALAAVAPSVPWQIKWPNDVLAAGAKCAGILVETSTGAGPARGDALILGIGVNVNRLAFPGGLATPATSLALTLGRPVDREAVLAKVLEEVERAVTEHLGLGPAPTARAVNEVLYLRGAEATLDGAPVRLLGVEPDGSLLVEDAAGPRVVVSGEVRAPEGALREAPPQP